MDSLLTIYSIGHSNLQIGKFLDLLKKFKIETLLDVRSSPYSQYNPQFNRETLQSALEGNAIQYKYTGDFLGGRPKDSTCYKDQKIPEGSADYLHLVDYPAVMTKDFFQKGINRLIEVARQEKVAIMCSEEDPSQCHRHHLIGKFLVSQDINVLHIRYDGNVVKDQLLPNLPEEPPAEQLSLF